MEVQVIVVVIEGIPEVWGAFISDEQADKCYREACAENGLDPEHPFTLDKEIRHFTEGITPPEHPELAAKLNELVELHKSLR